MRTIVSIVFLIGAVNSDGATTLKSYAGTYQCQTLMQVKPAIKQMDRGMVDVKIEGEKAKVIVKGIPFQFATEDMPNGLKEGDFEYRTGGPVQLVALSQMGPTKYLSFTYDEASMAVTGVACKKK